MLIIWQKGNPPITIIRHEAPFILTNFMPIFQPKIGNFEPLYSLTKCDWAQCDKKKS